MNKLIPLIVLTVATVATVAVAAPARPPKKTHSKLGIEIGMRSAVNLKANNFEYFGAAHYNEGRFLYTSAKLTRHPAKVWSIRVEQGAHVMMGRFTPSVSLYYSWAKVDHVSYKTKKIGYAAGLDYRVNALVSVGASMDDFATRHSAGTLKAVVCLGRHWHLITKVSEQLPSKDKAFSVALGYRFG